MYSLYLVYSVYLVYLVYLVYDVYYSYKRNISFIKNTEYSKYITSVDDIIDLNKYDKQNVHQISVENKCKKKINRLKDKYQHIGNIKDKYEEIRNELLSKITNDNAKLVINMIYDYDEGFIGFTEAEILSYVYLYIKDHSLDSSDDSVENNQLNNLYKELENNLLECFDDDMEFLCPNGRMPLVLQTLGISFTPVWVYKEEIINTILTKGEKLSQKYSYYRYLSNKQEDLNEYEKSEKLYYNVHLIYYLNKLFKKTYLDKNILNYNTLSKILLPNYKEIIDT